VPNTEVAGENYLRFGIAPVLQGCGVAEGGVKVCRAVLQPERASTFGPTVVKVLVDNNHCGYVPDENVASFAVAFKKLKRGQCAYCDARSWGSNEGGTWRVSLTLIFDGATEPEQNHAAIEAEKQRARAERADR